MASDRALIIGAGSTIARALLRELIADNQFSEIVAISRSPGADWVGQHAGRLQWLQSDYTESSVERIACRLTEFRGSFSRVIICNGILHNEAVKPEKRLEELTGEALQNVFQTNAVVPIIWLKNLCPILAGETKCTVAVFSARIGSIEDNRRGGWYSYRASKAALNMLLCTAAIEYTRRASNVRFMAFHPGTTDTPLSKPFQRLVPEGKLFKPEFVAHRLLELMSGDSADENIQFLDWAGKTVAW